MIYDNTAKVKVWTLLEKINKEVRQSQSIEGLPDTFFKGTLRIHPFCLSNNKLYPIILLLILLLKADNNSLTI